MTTLPANTESRRLMGRPPKATKHAAIIRATERQLVTILKDDVPPALRELVCGIYYEDEDGKRIYQRAPDIRAIELVMNRIMGDTRNHQGAAASVELDNGDGRRVIFSIDLTTGDDDSN